MPMMPFEPILQSEALAAPEVVGIAGLSGLLVTASFALVVYVLKEAAKERERERMVREKEADTNLVTANALQSAIETMREIMRAGGR